MRYLILVAALLLGACQTTSQNTAALPEADYGPVPTDWREQIDQWFARNLKDPGSLRILSMSEPQPERLWSGILCPGGYRHRQVVHVTYNARNSFGGYVGATDRQFEFKNGALNEPQPWPDCD